MELFRRALSSKTATVIPHSARRAASHILERDPGISVRNKPRAVTHQDQLWITCSVCNYDLDDDHNCQNSLVSIPEQDPVGNEFQFYPLHFTQDLCVDITCVTYMYLRTYLFLSHYRLGRLAGLVQDYANQAPAVLFLYDGIIFLWTYGGCGGFNLYYLDNRFEEFELPLKKRKTRDTLMFDRYRCGKDVPDSLFMYDDIAVEQVGDMDDPGTKHADQTRDELRVPEGDKPLEVEGDMFGFTSDDRQTSEEPSGNITAIDSFVMAGPSSCRVTRKVKTPSGVVEAVCLSDSAVLKYPKQDYLLGASPPDYAYAWAASRETITNGGERYYTPRISDRILLQALNFTHSSCLMCYKIVCPLPLFASQRYWVTYKTPTSEGSVGYNNVGFEWNPTEQDEVYVIVPWAYQTPVSTNLSGPELVLVPATEAVVGTDVATPVQISVFCCPIDLHFYTPRPISFANLIRPVNINEYQFPLRISGASGTLVLQSANDRRPCTWIVATMTQRQYSLLTDFDIEFQVNGQIIQFVEKDDTIMNQSWEPAILTDGTYNWQTSANEGSNVIENVDVMIIAVGNGSVQITENERLRADDVAEEQMYSYNPKSKVARKCYGGIGDHTARIDSHWGVINKFTLEPNSTQTFSTFARDEYIYQDLQRHYIYSKYPAIMVKITSTPQSNMLLRLTQIPSGVTNVGADELLQLPGKEFNIKGGGVTVIPYWDLAQPGRTGDSANASFGLTTLGGSTNGSTVRVAVFYNVQPIEYHHLKSAYDDEAEEQVGEDPERGYQDVDVHVQTDIELDRWDGQKQTTVNSEQRFQYVASIPMNIVDGGSEYMIKKITLNSAILGEYFWSHLRRYHMWRGCPRLKIMLTSPRTVNGNFHVIHSNANLSSVKIRSLLVNSSFAVAGAYDSPLIFDVKWRNLDPYLLVNQSTTQSLGYLYVVVPLRTGAGNVTMTIHVDTSDIQLQTPSHEFTTSGPPTLSVTDVARA